MARNEDFRKVSTLLFHNRDGLAGDWSGVLEKHKNLMHHQLYLVASEIVLSGAFEVHVVPDTGSKLPTTVATGRHLSFYQNPRTLFEISQKDSSYAYFTGVIQGLQLKVSEAFDPDQDFTFSAVLTSFSQQRQHGAREERFDYVSSTIITDKPSDDLINISLPTPDHSNMAYHQLMMTSDTPVGRTTYEVRVVPDVEEELETSVFIDNYLFFPRPEYPNGPFFPSEAASNNSFGGDTKSFIGWFGGVFRGIHLKALDDPAIGPEDGHLFTVVLSSSVEQFDETVYQYIGRPPGLGDVIDGLDDHLGDFDNPHKTSWDNLLNKPDLGITDWPLHKDFIAADQTLTIADGFQYHIDGPFDIEGELNVEGTLVIT
jgi:hypothetical protein